MRMHQIFHTSAKHVQAPPMTEVEQYINEKKYDRAVLLVFKFLIHLFFLFPTYQLPLETIVHHPEATPLPLLSHQQPCQQTPPLDNIAAQTETIDIMGRPQRQHLNAIGPKPLQSDLRIGGGRHPHPPSASNTKLKHKVLSNITF